jgi:hypothetical protein
MKMPLLYQFCCVERTRLFASFQLKSGPDPDLEFLAGELAGGIFREILGGNRREILALFFFPFSMD